MRVLVAEVTERQAGRRLSEAERIIIHAIGVVADMRDQVRAIVARAFLP
jgi:hypothetical protein